MLVVQIKTLQYTLVVTVSWRLIDFYGFYFIERKGREKHPLAVLLCVHSWLALACALTGTGLQPWCGGWRSPAELRPGLCSVLGICEWPLVRSRLDKMRECRRPPLGGRTRIMQHAPTRFSLSRSVCAFRTTSVYVWVQILPFCGFTQFLLCVLIRKPSHLYSFKFYIFF